MANNLEEFRESGKEQLEAATTLSSSFGKSLQTIAAETTDYSKKSIENGAAVVEKLLGVRTFESAIQIQSEYAKAFYEAFIAHATKIGELYSNLFKEALKPIEAGLAKVQSRQE
jgi:hypothetical protein